MVNVEAGTYYLPIAPTGYTGTYAGTLVLGTKDSGTSKYGVTWQAYTPNNPPIISGAIPVGPGGLGLTWKQTTGYTNVWQVTLPTTVGGFNLQTFESLYYIPSAVSGAGPSRRLRARVQSSPSSISAVGFAWNPSGSPVGCYYVNGPNAGQYDSNPNDCNLGTFLRVNKTLAPGADADAGNCVTVTDQKNPTSTKCLDRFYYNSGDVPTGLWTNLNGTFNPGKVSTTNPPCDYATGAGTYPQGDIGLMLFDAWTVDNMRIACVDINAGVIFLNAPTKPNAGQYNYFGPTVNHRYVIENTQNNFITDAKTNNSSVSGETQLWYFDTSKNILYYIAAANESPSSDTVLIPQLPYAASQAGLSNQFPQTSGTKELSDFVGGSLLWATNLSYVTFSGILFEMDDFVPSNWIGNNTGFNNDDNGDLPVPQAIDCEGCQNVIFNGITVAHTSGSGLLVASAPGNTNPSLAATGDTIENSVFEDIGDSAIRIGHAVNQNDIATSVVSGLSVTNNLIDGYSRVLPDGEGLSEGNGQGNTITQNDITDGYHAGISICQLGCGPFSPTGAGVNGTNIKSSYNHLWNMMQGITSDGGSLYYNVGNGPTNGNTSGGGSGTGDLIENNLVHDTTDSGIIDVGVSGSGYGGEGIYLDAMTGGVTVESNVVFHMSGFAVHLTFGPTITQSQNPNTFENNVFSLALGGMITENEAWANGCPSGTFTDQHFWWNIFNFDQTETRTAGSFFVVGGCGNSCGQNYYKFQDFEANAYYNTKTNFCTDSNAFHVLDVPNQSTWGGSCTPPTGVKTTFSAENKWLSFDDNGLGGPNTWQHGVTNYTPTINIDEDDAQDQTSDVGTCSWVPGFKTTGSKTDYLLSSGPPNNPFQPGPISGSSAYTNGTINTAGRTTESTIPTIPATFPTYRYGNTQF